MARNIALTLTLNGVQQTVQTIEELEIAINGARSELNKLTIGSSEFKRLQSEIQKADTALRNMKKQAEGIELEKQIGDFAKVGTTIVSSFAAAQAALSLFGSESENVALAAAKAQQTLTIALFAREAAEGAVALRTVKLTIATKAQTLADNTQIGVLKKLYTLIAANPYTALAVAIGTVVTAVIALTYAQDDEAESAKKAKEAQDEYNESLKTAGLQSRITGDFIGFMVNEFNEGRVSVEKLKESVMGLVPALKNLDLSTEEGRNTLNEYATATANLASAQDKYAAKVTQLRKAVSEGRDATAGALREELREIASQVVRYQTDKENIEKQDQKLEENRKKREEARKKRQEDLLKQLQEELDLILKRVDLEGKLLGELFKAQDFEPTEALIVQRLQERADAIKANSDALSQYIPFADQFLKSLYGITQIPEDEGAKQFGKLFEQISISIRTVGGSSGLATEQLQYLFDLINTEGVKAVNSGLFDETTNKNIVATVQNVKNLLTIFNQMREAGIETPDLNQFVTNVTLIKRELSEPFIDPQRRQELEGTLRQLQEDFVESYLILQKGSQDYQDALKKILAISEQLGETDEQRKKRVDDLNNSFRETGKILFEVSAGAVTELSLFRDGVNNVSQSVEILRSRIQDLSPQELASELIKNKDLLTEFFTVNLSNLASNRENLLRLDKEITTRRFDAQREFLSDVEQLEYDFQKQGIDISQLTYEQKLVLLQAFYQREVEITEEGEKKKQDSIDKTRNKILDSIAQFQQALNAVNQTVSDFYAMQFDQLEKRNTRVQESIIGESKRANELRLQQEKAYQAERDRLEKQQAKTSLRISLAQAIANAAQAITLVTAQTGVFAPIAAGIVAAASAAQIGIIANQLQNVDKYRRGGIIKKQSGGYISGPSHEYGGVKYQQGGVELEGRESVINRVSTIRYQELLSQINVSGGGRPIVTNNFDDSRIVEAIAEQRMEPIRAYVVESDITGKQNVQRRLEQLSQI